MKIGFSQNYDGPGGARSWIKSFSKYCINNGHTVSYGFDDTVDVFCSVANLSTIKQLKLLKEKNIKILQRLGAIYLPYNHPNPILIKNKKIGVSIFSNLAIITALNQLLKNILQRPRPTEYRIIEETGYSFPSGHSMISMALYGYIIYLIYKYVTNKYIKWFSIVLLSILICSIGISRIYLGVHYTSDVLGGFLISVSYLVIYISAVNKFLIEK